MHRTIRKHAAPAVLLAMLAAGALYARADAVTDWNIRAGEVMAEAKLGTPPAIRAMALVQTAVYTAATQATTQGASVDAAVAAANRAVLARLLPAQQASIEAAYQAALAPIAEGAAKAAGVATGEQAAAAVLARRADDMAAAAEDYRPHTTAGAYVPTAAPAAPHWARRKPWLMSGPADVRPAAPPALDSAAWVRDYNEVKALGAKASATRTPEQTDIARFWEYSAPAIYTGVVRSVALQPGRDVVRNAGLYAAVAQAMDDAMISVFDAKYHHNFWRPVTAIRNGDIDGNDATQRDAAWSSFIEAPMHPEYPSGHSILAASVGAVLKAEAGAGPIALATSSPTAKGATRRWSNVDDFVREVSASRIYAGIHYRTATETGVEMGNRIGAMAAARHLRPRYSTLSTELGK